MLRNEINYETVRDLKGYVDKYKSDNWDIDDICFSSYLSVIDKLIIEKIPESFSPEERKARLNELVGEKVDFLNSVASRSLNSNRTELSITNSVFLHFFKDNIAELNQAILYAMLRRGYRSGISIEELNSNDALNNLEICYTGEARRDKKSIGEAVHKVNEIIYANAKTRADLDKQLNPNIYLLDRDVSVQ